MNDLAKILKIAKFDDWYSVTSTTVCNHGGGGLLSLKYGGSLSNLLISVYPEYRNQPYYGLTLKIYMGYYQI